MSYFLVPFTKQYLQPALELFLQGYQQEQFHCPIMPSYIMDDPSRIRTMLETKMVNPGVAIVDEDRLLAYMVTGESFFWKGQHTSFVPEYCHGAIDDQKVRLYQAMYQHLAQEWVNSGHHLHLIGYFSHDILLQNLFYQLGFGALIAERLRDCCSIDVSEERPVRELNDISELVDLHMEHIHYYPQSPIFLPRTTDRLSSFNDLEAHAHKGDMFFVAYDNSSPCAYMIVGESGLIGEGFLLQKTKTAQIKSAYVRSDMRGKGIGTALLQRVIQWSREHEYERIFVEHETANPSGGNFWSRYFTSFVNFSMRYIDTTL